MSYVILLFACPVYVHFISCNDSVIYIFVRNGTLIVGDSRCCPLLRSLNDNGIICYAFRGAGIARVCENAKRLIRQHKPVVCLLLCGINDMTIMDKDTRVISPRFYDSFLLANYIVKLFLTVRSELFPMFNETKIIFGGIIGADINAYNRVPDTSPYQMIIDDAITQINSYLRLLNQLVLATQPRLTSKVHCWRKGSRRNYYHLLRDGLHLGPLIISTWIREIKLFHQRNAAVASLCSASTNFAYHYEPS